ncbi:MAG: hypothetical protein PVF83_03490 [Anaerolineales bacterium]|jgi:hypothetical protein
MSTEYDLQVLPLRRQDAQELGGVPSIHTAVSPRRPARGRKGDRLVIFLLFEGEHSFSRERVKQLMETMEKVYYKTSGSVTSAIRVLVGDLNELLLSYNLRQTSSGQQTTAHLSIAVARGEHLYLSQSGSSHAFLLTPGKVEHIHDPQTAGRGLGISRNPAVNFFQTDMMDGTLLVITSKMPKGWKSNTMEDIFGLPLKNIHRRLLEEAAEGFNGLMVETTTGQGSLTFIRSSKQLSEIASPRPSKPKRKRKPGRETQRKPQREPQPKPKAERDSRAWTPVEVPEETPRRERQAVRPPVTRRQADTGIDQASVYFERLEEANATPTQRPSRRQISPAVSGALLGFGAFLGRVKKGLGTFLRRILPGEDVLTISTPFMAISAIIVPLVVVAVSAIVYSSIGRTRQYQIYYRQAADMALMAQTESDFEMIHDAWENTLVYLDRAESYQTTPESEELRQLATSQLDEMDEVVRLSFKPAIAGNLSNSIKIRQMVATGQALYILDIESGHVLRAELAGTQFEMDTEFRCGPGSYGSMIVDKIIDIAPLYDPTQEGAEIVAMDINGNLLYCVPEEAPLAITLVPPDVLWGKPNAITVENDNLYVLDPLTNAVWYFEGDENYQFREAPYFYFREEVPTLKGAIDIAVDRDMLYILYDDGHTTTCKFSTLEEAPTSCDDPTPYTDSRQGRGDNPELTDMVFYQVQHTQPPEPSLYYLNPLDRDIYQFSLRLNLVQLYRPQSDFPEGLATAVAISPTRSIFLAQDNKVYLSFLP